MIRQSLALVAVAALTGCTVNLNTEGVTAQETHRFTVTGTPEVVLDTFAGAIEVHSWDRPEIEIEVEKRANDQSLLDEITVAPSQDGNTVRLTVTGPARYQSGVTVGVNISPRARLRVAMPRQATLTSTSRDGAIVVEDLSGALTLRSEDGSIRGSRLSGRLDVRTLDGSIRLEKIEGALDAESGDGSVSFDGVLTRLRVKTADGSVRATLEEGSRLDEDSSLETGDGSVVIRLPRTFDADLDASTRDGSVRSSHPLVTIADSDRRNGDARVTLGQGGRRLQIRSGDGSIRIE